MMSKKILLFIVLIILAPLCYFAFQIHSLNILPGMKPTPEPPAFIDAEYVYVLRNVEVRCLTGCDSPPDDLVAGTRIRVAVFAIGPDDRWWVRFDIGREGFWIPASAVTDVAP